MTSENIPRLSHKNLSAGRISLHDHSLSYATSKSAGSIFSTSCRIRDRWSATILAYSLYLFIATSMTIWVARTLSPNGKIYLIRCFGHDAELATSVNHLLVAGFYLVNFGFIALALSAAGTVKTTVELMRFLGWYAGIATLVLGAMHLFNMGAVAQHRRKVADWVHGQFPSPEPERVPAHTVGRTRSDGLLDRAAFHR